MWIRSQDNKRIFDMTGSNIEIGYSPYVMLYNKDHIPRGSKLRKLQRWVNNRIIFRSCEKFNDYQKER